MNVSRYRKDLPSFRYSSLDLKEPLANLSAATAKFCSFAVRPEREFPRTARLALGFCVSYYNAKAKRRLIAKHYGKQAWCFLVRAR